VDRLALSSVLRVAGAYSAPSFVLKLPSLGFTRGEPDEVAGPVRADPLRRPI